MFAKLFEEKSKLEGSPGELLRPLYLEGIASFRTHPSWIEVLGFPWRPEMVRKGVRQVWPEDVEMAEELRIDLMEYMEHMSVLSQLVMELLTEGLGLPPKHITQTYSRESMSRLIFNHFPPCHRPELAQGIPLHTDTTFLVILYQELGGLQVFRNGEWMGIRPDPNSFVVNIGDTFQAFSNGKYQSVQHRVSLNSTIPRFTIVFFLYPEDETSMVTPLPELVSESNPAKYRPIRFVDYRKFVFPKTGEPPHRLDNIAL